MTHIYMPDDTDTDSLIVLGTHCFTTIVTNTIIQIIAIFVRYE